jgi:hypothetical protein
VRRPQRSRRRTRKRRVKLREAEELRAAPASLKRLTETLAAILEEASEDESIERDLARGRRMRVRAPKPPRTFLEMDELVALIDAGGAHDAAAPLIALVLEADPGTTRARVADALARGQRPSEIAAAIGVSPVDGELQPARLGAPPAGEDQGRSAVCGTLARSGIRASELCDLRTDTSASTTRRRALAHPRRQDRSRRPRGPAEPRARRGVRPGTSTACGVPASRRTLRLTRSRTAGEGGCRASASPRGHEPSERANSDLAVADPGGKSVDLQEDPRMADPDSTGATTIFGCAVVVSESGYLQAFPVVSRRLTASAFA